ncbi:hypothetical protein B0H14DRAFT_3139304 [Mycena olivaceomarginata]|nr:hypothetical protein B0H14DRAFT_3139304 [Mycena olivaceomarginata]
MAYIPPRRRPPLTRFAPPVEKQRLPQRLPDCYVLIPTYDHGWRPKSTPEQSPPCKKNNTGLAGAVDVEQKSREKRKRTEQNGKPAAQMTPSPEGRDSRRPRKRSRAEVEADQTGLVDRTPMNAFESRFDGKCKSRELHIIYPDRMADNAELTHPQMYVFQALWCLPAGWWRQSIRADGQDFPTVHIAMSKPNSEALRAQQ